MILKQERKKYCLDLDILRILASLAVVLIHVSAQNWYTANDLKTFTVFNFFDSIARFAVPIFFMISGALFLDKNKKIDFKVFFKKHFLKIVMIYIVWCILYYFFDYFVFNTIDQITIKGIIKSVINNKFVLWFLKVMIYIYLFLPFIKTLVDHCNERQIQYFLLIFFVLGILFYQLSTLSLPIIIKNLIINMRINDKLWYFGYFVLGWYLYNKDISLAKRKFLYFLGLLSCIICFLYTDINFANNGVKNENLYGYFSITTFIYSISLFVFVKYLCINKKLKNINLTSISKNTFGIYLVHIFVLDYLNKIGLNTLTFNPVLSTIFITFLVYVISYCITFVLRKIPIVKGIV